MVTKEGSKLVLSRKDRSWVCSECDKEYKIAPTQCTCGAPDKVFLEKDMPVEESTRKDYHIKANIIYEATEIKKGSIVSLIAKDRCTKNLLLRNLIEEVKDSKKEEVKAGA